MKKDGKKAKTSPSVSGSSAEDSTSVISSSLAGSASCLTTSANQAFSGDKSEPVVNNKLQIKLDFVDFPPVKDRNQDKAGNYKTAVFKEGDKTASKLPGQTAASGKKDNVQKVAPNVPSGDEKNGTSLEGTAPWVPEEVTYNVTEEPCPSAKVADPSPSEISKDGQQGLEKEKSTVLTHKDSEKVPEKVPVKGITTDGPKTADLQGAEKDSSRAPVKEGPKAPNSKFPDNRKEWLELTTLRGMKKASAAMPSKDISKTPPLSFFKNNFTNPAKLSVNISEKTDSKDIVSNTIELETPTVSQKPSLSSQAKPVFTTSCFSLFSPLSANHNGELFTGEGLKTYSKKTTANKRKSGSKESFVEDNPTVSKVLKMDKKESSEVGHVKNIIQENSEVELAKKLSKKLSNLHPEGKTLNRLPQNSVTAAEKGKASRKKSTEERKLQSKKAKCEENKPNGTSADAIRLKSVLRVELQDHIRQGTENGLSPVDSVSFVADQVVDEVLINHSPTVKDVPANQFEAFKVNTDRLHSRSKERIREMTTKKKELKAKEEKRKAKKKASSGLPTVVNKQPETVDSLETVVDSVLDEEIAVIYKGDGKCPIT